jgi:ATP-dependent DNA helicase RecQ
MALEQPDPEGWLPASLRLLNQRLCDEGCSSSAELVSSLLKSLSEDGRGFAGTQGSVNLRFSGRDTYLVRVRPGWTWKAINDLAEKRRRLASLVLDTLLSKIPSDAPARADFLVEFHFEELHQAIDRDLLLRAELRDIDAAIERALMFLHEQRVIILQHGLAVFRSAMTIRFEKETRGEKYKAADYQPLEHHYKERILQVHVMSEYARLGLERIQAALELVLAYFTLTKEEFLLRYFQAKPDLLQHATTAHSFQRIVTDLASPAQIKVVTAPLGRNMLILAGPGSGKTRTVVHRCAYLLRVERVRPQSVLVCCFNRHAAIELRRRLKDLVGDDARGVTVLTYHALAMRLLGLSFSSRADSRSRDIDFDALIKDAVKLLRGEQVPAGLEADEVRDRLLAGFQHILVDEYQDIDEPQYEMISAIAGRTLDDADQKLSILAVGDDDQNIYTFRGANVQFIRRFQQDYEAEVHYLVENYRSTRYIIEAANGLIAANVDRMKTRHPIRIDRHRELLGPGGEFGRRDGLSQGKVQLIQVADGACQAQAVLAEIRRLRELGVTDWSSMAVLSREHSDLAQVRTLAEKESIPVRWFAGRSAVPPLHQIREISSFLAQMEQARNSFVRASELTHLAAETLSSLLKNPPGEGTGTTNRSNSGLIPVGRVPSRGALGFFKQAVRSKDANPWTSFLMRLLEAWRDESGDAERPMQEAIEFLYEGCAESRREFTYGEGVTLCTVHSAKGTEFDHVLLVGPWRLPVEHAKQEEERRMFYVGLTRARKTLAVFDRGDARPSLPGTLNGAAILRREFTGKTSEEARVFLNYQVLSLEDINLSYPGWFNQRHPIHAALAALQPGDKLHLARDQGGNLELRNVASTPVARLSKRAQVEWSTRLDAIKEVRFLAAIQRTADQEADSARRERLQVQVWEIPLVEIISEQPK